MNEIGKNIEAIRKAKGISQYDLACKSGISLKKIESLNKKIPYKFDALEIISICRILEVSSDIVLGLRSFSGADAEAEIKELVLGNNELTHKGEKITDFEKGFLWGYIKKTLDAIEFRRIEK